MQALVGNGGGRPIVVVAINYDPVERDYAASLARPGGGVTGVFLRQPELAAKQLEYLALALPGRTELGIVWDAITAGQFDTAQKAAASMRLRIHSLKLENPPYDFDAAFRRLAAEGAQYVLVLSSPFFGGHSPSVGEFALRHRLPTMFTFRGYAVRSGLMSYGADGLSALRRAAGYVAKILNGAQAADLPIEQMREFELVINLKTAKALGLALPESLLARADDLIE